jgi:hypothetical protein
MLFIDIIPYWRGAQQQAAVHLSASMLSIYIPVIGRLLQLQAGLQAHGV